MNGRKKALKYLAAASSLAVLASCQAVMRPYAESRTADGSEYTVSGPEQCRRLLMETASAGTGPGRREIYVTGEDYVPETLVLAQMFPDIINISNTKLYEEQADGKTYVTCRIGFERRGAASDCVHGWEREVLTEPGCLTRGRERIVCRFCGYGEEQALAPLGHEDGDSDSLCDRCAARFVPQKAGDVITILYESENQRLPMEFQGLSEQAEGGMLYGYQGTIPREKVLAAASDVDGTEEERILWWLRNDFFNGISVHSACNRVCLLDRDGRELEALPPGEEIRPGIVLKTPETEAEGEKNAWMTGDILVRRVGNETYRFRCIDDDYGDANSYYQKSALFLCETVIRSDVDSTDFQRKILPFGETNEYKRSAVRAWLLARSGETGEDLLEQFTGVNSAFEGRTGNDVFGQMDLCGFIRHDLPFQTCYDKLFLLSLEEAFLYREELWEADGGGSPYSRGYWLRTPVFSADENGSFVNGTGEYAVDLEQGCVRPAEVSDTEFGIRPAFCLPQA